MTARSRLVSVTTTATALNNSPETSPTDNVGGSAATIYNDGTVTVYIGGSDVTTTGATKGIPINPGDSLPVEGQNSILYGRVVTGTCDVIVLEVGI